MSNMALIFVIVLLVLLFGSGTGLAAMSILDWLKAARRPAARNERVASARWPERT